MNDIITIDRFNKLTGQETLHPLVGIADLTGDRLEKGIEQPCTFYALVFNRTSLQLITPGEMFRIPAASDCSCNGYTGVLFHPDILCDTPLERNMGAYPCRCRKTLCAHDRDTIDACINCIAGELQHAIDRYSSKIIVSQIALLLNYCVRFCQSK